MSVEVFTRKSHGNYRKITDICNFWTCFCRSRATSLYRNVPATDPIQLTAQFTKPRAHGFTASTGTIPLEWHTAVNGANG